MPPRTYADDPATSVSAWATRPPVHDSAVATVRPSGTHRAWSRAASSTSWSAILGARGPGRCPCRREQPRLGVALRREPADVLAVEGEVGRVGLARPDLDPAPAAEGEHLAHVEHLARAPGDRRDLAVDPDLEPGPTVLH